MHGFTRYMATAMALAASAFASPAYPVTVEKLFEEIEHGYIDNDGVKIHYVTLGEGPLVLFIHGFPDLWYTWRHQMAALSDNYQVVAMDQRGYNRSDKPKGKENYDFELLVSDVAAVVRHFPQAKGTIVGHDWGGSVSWQFAMKHPELINNLIIFNRPHPRGRNRELATNNRHKQASVYVRRFKDQPGDMGFTAEALARRFQDDPEIYQLYLEGFARSDFEAMTDYYRQNYPDPPYLVDEGPPNPVKCPVLMFHGLDDRALGHEALNHMWEWLDKDLTLVTLPGVGHNSHLGPIDFVTGMMKSWLDLKTKGQ